MASADPRFLHPSRYAVVGIDVGKSKHVAAALTADGGRYKSKVTFENSQVGVRRLEQQLLRHLGKPEDVVVAMEATGHYWMNLHSALVEMGYACAVLNPIQTRVKFQSRVRKTKTDRLDAVSIAEVFRSGDLRPSRIPDEDTLALRLLTRHRWRLTQLIGDLKRGQTWITDLVFPEYASVFPNPWLTTGQVLVEETGLEPTELVAREDELPTLINKASRGRLGEEKAHQLVKHARDTIAAGRAETVLGYLARNVQSLRKAVEAQRNEVDREIEEHMGSRETPLYSLGINTPLVATIHAESDPISDFPTPTRYVAYCGLDPTTTQSGNYTGSRAKISKRGSPYLRTAFYLAAAGRYRSVPALRKVYDKHRKRGRHHNDALVIVAHKLARIVWRVLTDNRPFRTRPPRRGT